MRAPPCPRPPNTSQPYLCARAAAAGAPREQADGVGRAWDHFVYRSPPSGQEEGRPTEARLRWPCTGCHRGRPSASPSTPSRRPSSTSSPASSTSSSPTLALREVRAASPARSAHGRAKLTAYLFLPTTPPTLPSTHPRLLVTQDQSRTLAGVQVAGSQRQRRRAGAGFPASSPRC